MLFFYAGIPAAFQIDQLVADHETLREVQIEFVPRIKQELRRRLAAAAGLVGRFGCDVNFLKADAFARQFTRQMLIDTVHFGKREVTAPDAGLVGNDEEFETRVLQSLQSTARAGKNHHVLGARQIIFFRDQRSVAVEKNSRFHSGQVWFDCDKNGIELFPKLTHAPVLAVQPSTTYASHEQG